ncbi:MAG TPA: septal ring lytic transglycosylase RlpA family protein [Marinobacterium sp.]|nr:septal ring lytic transglycosylase RlpA family protein [Marinobacterium sp.]
MRIFVSSLICALALAGCSAPEKVSDSRYTMKQDKAPENPPDVSNVPDAVPMDVAYSRGGNKPVYQVWGKTYRVLDTHIGYREEGIASWYGLKFHGHKTSNGEIYDIYKMSAAHKSLPIPSYARVTNLDNGKSVIVRVNDRGPFHEDRIIDLSYAAASRLDITQKGTGRVLVEAIDARGAKRPEPVSSDRIAAKIEPNTNGAVAGRFLQVGAFGNAENAQRAQLKLASLSGENVKVVPVDQEGRQLHRVLLGPLSSGVSVDGLINRLLDAGYSAPILVDSP